MIPTEEQRGTVAFDLEKARAVDIDLLAATDWGELRARYRAALAEIERLRADNAGLSKAVVDIGQERDLAQAEFRAYHQAWEEQAARIKELGGALAEYQRHGKIISEAVVPCLTVHGNCDQCRPKTKAACEAIGAIRKGKIGPDARPPCWQITEERVDVLGFCLSGEFDRCGCAECDHAVAVLRAMLKEAL